VSDDSDESGNEGEHTPQRGRETLMPSMPMQWHPFPD
jgi:hypothetical protein